MFDGRSPDGKQSILKSVASRAEQSELEEGAAQGALSRATQLRRLWVGLSDQIAQGTPVAAYLECERALKKPDDLPSSDLATLRELSAHLRPRTEEVVADLERAIPEALESAGLVLDPSARHPIYTMDSGFIALVVDEKKLVATITARGGAPSKEPLDPTAVARTAVEVRDRVFRRTQRHVSQTSLTRAYQTLKKDKKLGGSDDIPIEAIRMQLSRKGRPIPADEFNVDLAGLVRAAAETGGPRITLSNTRDTRSGILLYGLEDAGYVGYLKIEGV